MLGKGKPSQRGQEKTCAFEELQEASVAQCSDGEGGISEVRGGGQGQTT